MQVDSSQSEQVQSWNWAAADQRLFLHQFKGLPMTVEYQQQQNDMSKSGREGVQPLARLQMELMSKVS